MIKLTEYGELLLVAKRQMPFRLVRDTLRKWTSEKSYLISRGESIDASELLDRISNFDLEISDEEREFFSEMHLAYGL